MKEMKEYNNSTFKQPYILKMWKTHTKMKCLYLDMVSANWVNEFGKNDSKLFLKTYREHKNGYS
jgi:hypothetical protein